MTNECYKILCAAYEVGRRGLGTGALLFEKESTRGKTHTIQAFRREESHPRVVQIPPSSDKVLYEFIADNRDAYIFFIDDVSEWDSIQMNSALSFLKQIACGSAKQRKMNFKTRKQTEIELSAFSVLIGNGEQISDMTVTMRHIGLAQRILHIKSGHTKDELRKIKAGYKEHGYGKKNLPKFKVPEDYFKDDNEIPEAHEKWIDDSFGEMEAGDSVKLIASVVKPEYFEELKPCLLSGKKDIEFKEEIEFID